MSHQSVAVSLPSQTGRKFGNVPEPVGQGRQQ
jgi:hypothetical protein